WAQQRGLRADDEPATHREREYLVLARVLLAQDRPGQALALLDRLLAQAATGAASATLSRYARCKPQRTRPAATSPPGWPPWSRRSPSPARKAICGSSPTRGHRWVPCSVGWSPPTGAKQAPARRIPLSCLARLVQAFDGKLNVPRPGEVLPQRCRG